MTTRVTYDHQVTYDHRQVGQAGKVAMHPKRLDSILYKAISSAPRELNYRRLEEGRVLLL